MTNIIMDVIRILNDGNIIPKQEDGNTKIDLYNDKVQLSYIIHGFAVKVAESHIVTTF